MKMLFFSIILLSAISLCCKSDTPKAEYGKLSYVDTSYFEPCYSRMVENNKVGYIDSFGKIVIRPVFANAFDFSEGLAAARVDGQFGFINSDGNFVIPAKYDFCESFRNGFAIVYKNGNPLLINKKGEEGIENKYSKIMHCGKETFYVITEHRNVGVVKYDGTVIADTLFSMISEFTNGYAVVERKEKKNSERVCGVIDSNGNFIVKYNTYINIETFYNGYYKAQKTLNRNVENPIHLVYIMDEKGNVLFEKEEGEKFILYGKPNCGIITALIEKPNYVQSENDHYSSEHNYYACLDMKGDYVINDTNHKKITDFSCNRAFVRDTSDGYRLIDKKGNYIATTRYQYVDEDQLFISGYAIVRMDYKWGIIDTNGSFVTIPKFEGIVSKIIDNKYFIFTLSDESDDDRTKYGVALADKNGSVVIKPTYDYIDVNGFVNGLIKCYKDNLVSYVNNTGKIVWQEKTQSVKTITDVNIDFMNRGYFTANSVPYKTDLGGHGTSENGTQKLDNKTILPKNRLSISVYPDSLKTTLYGYNGILVRLSNSTKKTFLFSATDGLLPMVVQAKNANGKWEDIEYVPSSFCGNSYHTLSLKPQEYWSFLTPRYKGSIATKLRIKVEYTIESEHSKKEYVPQYLYSNEYDGSVNPAQFWRKLPHYSTSLMDPYVD